MKSREELVKENEAYRADLTKGVDQAQEEIVKVAKKALLAGGVDLTISMIRNTFFVKDKKKKKYKSVEQKGSFLAEEASDIAILEFLKFTKSQLSDILEKQKPEKDECKSMRFYYGSSKIESFEVEIEKYNNEFTMKVNGEEKILPP